ncbi:MAG: hypothetical protein U0073_12100 [Bacteroidia bacterium]
MNRSIFLTFFIVAVLCNRSFSQAINSPTKKSFNVSGLYLRTLYSIEAGLEFEKNKHSLLFSIRYADYNKHEHDIGIMGTYRHFLNDTTKRFRTFYQGSLYLMNIDARLITNTYYNSRANAFVLFLGTGFNYRFIHTFSLGLNANIGWGRGWGHETNAKFLGFEQPPNYSRSFFMLNPQINLRYQF